MIINAAGENRCVRKRPPAYRLVVRVEAHILLIKKEAETKFDLPLGSQTIHARTVTYTERLII